VLLMASSGLCIRFPATDVRVFAGRNSIGVRGMSLAEGDTLISMAILRHVDATPAERSEYIRRSRAVEGEAVEDVVEDEAAEGGESVSLDLERYGYLGAREEFVLTLSEFGFGKRSSSYDFRTSGRGGKGIRATDISRVGEIGKLIAGFPVEAGDQVMMISDRGQMIRVPVEGIRVASRATKGVTIFKTADGERIVSVERIPDQGAEVVDELDGEAPPTPDASSGDAMPPADEPPIE
jgi:DNA gyrase subunit A